MPTVSLNAFLKILSKSSPQKAAEYGRYLTPGGYDFYWMLKEAVRARSVGGKDLAECSKAILKIDRTVEKKHNLGALTSFDKWLTKQGVVEFFECPVGSCSSPEEHLKIKLEPAFGYVWKGQRRIVHTWASQSITLPRSVTLMPATNLWHAVAHAGLILPVESPHMVDDPMAKNTACSAEDEG